MFCRDCTYDLRSLAEPRCPECGRVFDPTDPRTFALRPRTVASRWPFAVGLVAAAWPLITHTMFLATSLVARASLGHWPRPNFDYPGSVSVVAVTMRDASILTLVACQVTPIFAIVMCAYLAVRQQWRRSAIVLVVGLVAWAAFVPLIRFDPLMCFDWILY
ncbi:MAG: hypothetical protein ACKVW3_01230 [Phycisphaerales bacterium]